MPNTRLTDETTFDIEEEEGCRPLRVVLIYQDIAAGQRGMRVLNGLARGVDDDLECQPSLWSFDLLSDPEWRETITDDALKADMLVLSASDPNPLPEAVERWAKDTIVRKRGTITAVVAIFGSDDLPDNAASPQLQVLQAAARQAGLDFFAPAARHGRSEFEETLEQIHRRADMITPVLAEILHHRLPPPGRDERSSGQL